MNERLKNPLFGGISYGLLFAIIVLITGRFFFNRDFDFPVFIRSAPILIPLFAIFIGILSILAGKLLGIDNPSRNHFARASVIALFVMLCIFVLYISFLYLTTLIAMSGIDVPQEPYVQIPQIREDQRLLLYIQCGTNSGAIFGIIFGLLFGIVSPTINRIKSMLLAILFGALGFGFGGLLSGGIDPMGYCLLLKLELPLWRLVLDGTIFGFFGGAGIGLMQYIINLERNIDGVMSNE